jgi:hypothetical protein
VARAPQGLVDDEVVEPGVASVVQYAPVEDAGYGDQIPVEKSAEQVIFVVSRLLEDLLGGLLPPQLTENRDRLASLRRRL